MSSASFVITGQIPPFFLDLIDQGPTPPLFIISRPDLVSVKSYRLEPIESILFQGPAGFRVHFFHFFSFVRVSRLILRTYNKIPALLSTIDSSSPPPFGSGRTFATECTQRKPTSPSCLSGLKTLQALPLTKYPSCASTPPPPSFFSN